MYIYHQNIYFTIYGYAAKKHLQQTSQVLLTSLADGESGVAMLKAEF